MSSQSPIPGESAKITASTATDSTQSVQFIVSTDDPRHNPAGKSSQKQKIKNLKTHPNHHQSSQSFPGVHHHLHLVLCISPSTTSLASMRSSSCDCSCLFRCCTVVHVEAWSAESLQGLATSGCSIFLDDDPKNSWENIGWWISLSNPNI